MLVFQSIKNRERRSLMTNVVDKQSSSTTQDEESSAAAGVSGATYWKYFQSGSGACSFILFMLSCLTSEILFCASDYWLNLWTSTESGRSLNPGLIINGTERNSSLTIGPVNFLVDGLVLDRNMGIYVYSILIGGVFIFGFLRAAQFYGIATSTSLKLHDNMFQAVIGAPVQFFDKNSLG